MARSETVDSYLASFPPDIQEILAKVRETILDVVPGAEEKISYGIPTVSIGGRHLVYFADSFTRMIDSFSSESSYA